MVTHSMLEDFRNTLIIPCVVLLERYYVKPLIKISDNYDIDSVLQAPVSTLLKSLAFTRSDEDTMRPSAAPSYMCTL